jgi:integrase
MLRERATPVFVQDILGHVNIDVTQNVYGNNWGKERVDAATRAVEGVTNTAQNAEKEEKKNQLESVSLAGLDVQHSNRLLSRM